MKQMFILPISLTVLCATACDSKLYEPQQDLLESPCLEMVTRSGSGSLINDDPCLLEETEDLKKKKEIADQLKTMKSYAATTDDFFDSNMWAIDELPVTIKVRSIASGSTSGYNYLFVDEKGKEVTLTNSGTQLGNRFYFKKYPAYAGFPYRLFSNVTKTPLAVGQYNTNPDVKILMSTANSSVSGLGLDWDLIPAEYKGYFIIKSETYLGQADPENPWSVFNYVLEAKANNKLGYAQRVNNKAQQEFLITPLYSFTLSSLEYDLDNATIISRPDISKVTSVIHSQPFAQTKEITVSVSAEETSVFNQTASRLNLTVKNTKNLEFPRPMPVAGKAILPEDPENNAVFYSTTIQKATKTKSYNTSIEMKPNTLLQLTSKFKTFELSVPFVATAEYTYNGVRRVVKIAGVWKGYTLADPSIYKPVEEPRFYDLETGELLNYTHEYDMTKMTYIVK